MPYPVSRRDFKYGYKYILSSADGGELHNQPVIEEDVVCPPLEEASDHVMQYKFQQGDGIVVRAGQKLQFAMWINYNDGHNRCFYSETGDDHMNVDNEDRGLFTVTDSGLSTNSTRAGRGIVPGLLYQLM
jgi:hypothetical protein